eukprot:Ihof_evm2s394 gene=Ihof_evmTU2s394
MGAMSYLSFFVCALLSVGRTEAWGPVGHYATAAIAEFLMDPFAVETTFEILDGQTMASVSSWPDSAKYTPKWRWTSDLHFCDSGDNKCSITYKTDCHDRYGNPGRCVIGAVHNYTIALKADLEKPEEEIIDWIVRGLNLEGLVETPSTPSTPTVDYNPHKIDEWALLTFIVHYVGDMHQPMHVAHHKDLGGNLIKVKFEGKPTELHAIWDDLIIGKRMRDDFDNSEELYVSYLIEKALNFNFDDYDVSTCKNSSIPCLMEWANESAADACLYGYEGVTEGEDLG